MTDAIAKNHSLPAQYAAELLVMRSGDGVRLEDTAGKRYLDFAGGIAVNALGYGREDLARAAYEQMLRLPHISNVYASEPTLELARRLRASGDWAAVFFGNSGSEANEAALKYARLYALRTKGPDHHRILCFSGAFHGRTMGAISCTPTAKYQDPFVPLVPGVAVAPYNDEAALERALDGGFAAVIVEVVQGEGGLSVMSPGFAAALNRLCQKHDALLIADEVQTGLCRTGDLFASRGVGLEPDMVTLAKPLAGGLPLSAVLIPEKVNRLIHYGEHGTTFGGGPVDDRGSAEGVGHRVAAVLRRGGEGEGRAPAGAARGVARASKSGERRARPRAARGVRLPGRRGRADRPTAGKGPAGPAVGDGCDPHRPAAHYIYGRDRRRREHHRGGTAMSEANGVKNPAPRKNVKKIALAYSGGLDTSIIIPWLKENYAGARWWRCAPTSDRTRISSGLEAQGEVLGRLRSCYVVDMREEFVRDYLFPMLRSGARLRGQVPAGHLDRPAAAGEEPGRGRPQGGRDAVAHGCTGKGNDQVRFELAYKALAPQLNVIAPWRDVEHPLARGRHRLRGVPTASISARSRRRTSTRATATSGTSPTRAATSRIPGTAPQEPLFQLTQISQGRARTAETEVTIDFEQGIPVAVNGEAHGPVELLVAAQPHRRASTASAASTWWRTGSSA